MKPSLNDAERALVAARSPENYPELFRQLREAILIFLLPYHPEIEGVTGLGNGDPLPPFVVWKNPTDGVRIPIFTSMECAQDACIKTGARKNQYAFCEMKGSDLFHLLSCQNHKIILNPATDFPAFLFDLRAAKKLADGSILTPIEEDQQQNGKIRIVNPADYPTDLLQPLFRFLRKRKEVQAAWIFRQKQTEDPNRPCYVFALKVTGDFKAVEQDFSIVLLHAGKGELDYGIVDIDQTNPTLVQITLKHPAFYAAPDYKAPSPLGDEQMCDGNNNQPEGPSGI